MFFYLIVIVITLPIVELTGLWWLNARIGIFGTLVWIVATAFFGAGLARRQWDKYWTRLNRQLDGGEQPTDTVLHGLLTLLAGLFLILPGLLTDTMGLLLLLPFVRNAVIQYGNLRFQTYRLHRRRESDENDGGDVIDV